MAKIKLQTAKIKENKFFAWINNHRKITGLILVVCVIGIVCLASGGENNTNVGTLNTNADDSGAHAINIISHSDDIVMEAKDYNKKKSTGTTFLDNIDEQGGAAVVTDEEGKVVWNFTTKNDGKYYIKVDYYTVLGSSTDMERNVYVDGERITSQAIDFKRSYKIAGDKQYDVQGNEIRQREDENICWQEMILSNTGGYSDEMCQLELKKGSHEISFDSVVNGMAIGKVTLISNAEKIERYQKTDSSDDKDIDIKIQAEEYKNKSDASILTVNDKTSPATEPSSPSVIVYNAIGGSTWAKSGQWIEWEVEVPEDGNYQIGFRWRQSEKMGGISSRVLYIDGKIPFEEASRVAFEYNSSWSTSFLGEEEPWTFHLTKGKHTIRLMANLGDMSDTLKQTNALIEKLNNIYMKIIMVSGTSPDLNRDYDFRTQIPDVIESYNETAKEIKAIIDECNEKTNKSQSTTELQQVYDILTEMYKDPETTAKRLSDYQSSITTLATWLTDSCDQPLELDYIMVTSKGKEMPKAGSSFFKGLAFSIKQLVASYTIDYTNIGNTTETEGDDDSLVVWLMAGTEQAQVTQQLINEQFIPDTNVPVKMQNVTAGAIMPAVLVGQGPDVVIGLTEAEPINYATRGVLKDLNEYSDINEVIGQYATSTYDAFKLEKGLYAIPTSVDFPVLFYRKDVLEELGITLEDCSTWDTTLQVVLPKLQIKNLRFGLTPSLASYLMFYYQTGNELYSDDKLSINFDTQEASNSFKKYTSIYTDYKQSLSFSFPNLFRTGEMPVAVMAYSAYYQLAEFAPEIMDKCGIAPIPGTKDKNGNINHTSTTTVTGAAILEDTKLEDEAWQFLKWWTKDATQAEYAKQIETILGISGRVSVVSDNVRKTLGWSTETLNVLNSQLEESKGVPQVPGSYYVSRYYDFAFRDVAYDNKDIVQSLISITEDINTEIREKTEELKNNYK